MDFLIPGSHNKSAVKRIGPKRTMKKFPDLTKLTTKCGKQFNKGSLTVLAFTLPDFESTSTYFTLYQTNLREFILCINHYDVKKDYITVDCELIPEQEALPYLNPKNPHLA